MVSGRDQKSPGLLSPHGHGPVPFFVHPLKTSLQSIAVIDGSLCQLTREGVHAAVHAPLATAVVEFCRGLRCYYVREHPHGLLPGIPNLYCLDRELRLQWLAEWPLTDDPCAAIVEVEDDVLTVVSKQGVRVRIDAHTGRLLPNPRDNSAAGSAAN